MSDYVPSVDGAMRRHSRRLLNRNAHPQEAVVTGITNIPLFLHSLVGVPGVLTPMRPFEELYTPTHQDRPSVNRLQFTPLTPIRETPRRLSFAFKPPKLPFSNRSLIIGTITFLVVSAVYKSGIIGWALRMREVENNARELLSRGIRSSNDAVPVSLYEDALFEIEQLGARLISVEAAQSVFNRQCLARDFSAEMQIEAEHQEATSCRAELSAYVNMHEEKMSECSDAIVRIEVEQIQVLDKIESEFEGKLNNLLSEKQAVVDQLEMHVASLTALNEDLVVEAEVMEREISVLEDLYMSRPVQFVGTPAHQATEEPVDASVDDLDDSSSAVVPDSSSAAVPSEIESLEESTAAYNAAILVLSALVALLSVVCGVLYLSVRSRLEIVVSSPAPLAVEVTERAYSPPVVDVTAVEERDPAEDERLHMAQEDVAARIAREVRAQLEVIEAHHEREMSMMRAIVEETHKTSIEIGTIMKDVMDETSIVSTNQNSPCQSPGTMSSCSFEPTREDMDISSLSVMLETSVTPIRVPLRDRETVKATSSIPTCYSIASPSNRSNNRRTRRLSGDLSSPSSGDEFDSDDENLREANFENQMAQVWKNFNC